MIPSHGKTRLIALMNQKGGVGKTTSAVNLGAALALSGHRTLLIDLDPQAHLTLHIGLDPNQLEYTLYDLMADDEVTATDVVRPVDSHENLFVLPSHTNLAGIEAELAPKMVTGTAQRVLKQKCKAFLGHESRVAGRGSGSNHADADSLALRLGTRDSQPFDFVLIDCPPSLGLLTINALTLAREVLVPMQAHFLALQGFGKLMETIQLVRQSFNPDLIVSGILLSMHENQTLLAQEVLSEMERFLADARSTDLPWCHARVLEPPVRRNIKLAECPSFGQTIFTYEPTCHGAEDYRRVAADLLALNGDGQGRQPAEAGTTASPAPPEPPAGPEPPAENTSPHSEADAPAPQIRISTSPVRPPAAQHATGT